MGLEAFEAAGHYDPAAPRAAERAELLRHLVERFGEEAVLATAERVPVFTVAVELTDPEPRRMSAREVAAAAGVDVEDVVLLRAAAGRPVSGPDARDVPSTMIDVARSFGQASGMFGRDATLAFVRVVGRVSQQIGDAARSLFATALVEEAGPGAVTELELSQANEVAWTAYQSIPRVLEHLVLDRAGGRLDLITGILEGDLRQAVAFVDLVGSTEWAARVDPRRHAAALARFEAAAWEAAATRGGRLVKLIGDEAMVVGDDPEMACAIAWDLCCWAAADPDLPEARAGVAHGPVVARAGDYFGPVVNLAARVRGEAPAGSVVATAEAAAALPAAAWTAEPLGPVELRGVPQPVELVRVRGRT